MNDALYFGCWSSTGHYLFNSKGGSEHAQFHPAAKHIDGLLGDWVEDVPENLGRVHVIRFGVRWTILAFWDRSVDSRGGSHSSFIFKGAVPAAEAMAKAKELFPHVFARAKFPIALEHVDMFTEVEANNSGG